VRQTKGLWSLKNYKDLPKKYDPKYFVVHPMANNYFSIVT